MEYLASNINMIGTQVKKNRTYEISHLFKQNFPEVQRGFSERNMCLFCSKHGISKMNDVEVDAIIQDCVIEVSSYLLGMNLSNKMLVEINLFTFQVGPTYGRK